MLKEIFIAFNAFGKAHAFIKMHKLWKWIVIPGLLYMLLFLTGMYFFWTTASGAIDGLINFTGIKGWLSQMDLGWLNFLFSLAGFILTLLLLLGYFSLFKYIWLIVGSPIFGYLSEKTESILENKDFPFSWKQLFKDAWRGVRLAGRNALWQTVYTITIIIVSFIPIVGWAAPVFALFIECYYYGFSMLDYSCERHKLNTAQSIKFIGNHKGLAIGNGIVFYGMHLIPVLGWIFAPAYAVIAATLSLYHNKQQLNLSPTIIGE